MRIVFQASAVLLAVLSVTQAASATPRTGRLNCQTHAITDLRRLSPRGYAIYDAMKDKKFFLTWLTCEDVQVGLATAVHESVHVLTEQRDAYPLIDGGSVRRPHEASRFYPPRETARAFSAKDPYVQNYLRPGGASSKDDFVYLLDELNAYTHDLNSAVKLVSLQRHDRQVDQRDGLSALMMFVMNYVETAKKAKPATWEGLQRSQTRRVVRTLWKQAETTLASSCGIDNFGMNDVKYISFVCDAKNGKALTELLGRAPACPTKCLSPTITSSIPKASKMR